MKTDCLKDKNSNCRSKIEFLEDVIDKQKTLLYYYSRQEEQKSRKKEIIQTDKKIKIDLAYLEHLKQYAVKLLPLKEEIKRLENL